MPVKEMNEATKQKIFGSGLIIFGGQRSPHKLIKNDSLSHITQDQGPPPDIAMLAIGFHEKKEKEQRELKRIVNIFTNILQTQTKEEITEEQIDSIIEKWLKKTTWPSSSGEAIDEGYPEFFQNKTYRAIFQFTKRYCLNNKELPQGNLTINEYVKAPRPRKRPFTGAQVQLDVGFPVLENKLIED